MVVNERQTVALARVVGQNCKRIRIAADVTQNVLAMRARDAGLRWTASKVGDFESGRTAPTLATVIAVTKALSGATNSKVSLADLVAFDGFVTITDELAPSGDALQSILRDDKGWHDLYVEDDAARQRRDVGELVVGGQELSRLLTKYRDRLSVADLDVVHEIGRRSGLDEDRLAKRLGVGPDELAILSCLLWRRSFSDERDHRAGADANAQKRGRVSRTLQAELERAIADGNH